MPPIFGVATNWLPPPGARYAPEADVGEWPLSGIENAFAPPLLTAICICPYGDASLTFNVI
jgi:hypothetical protein